LPSDFFVFSHGDSDICSWRILQSRYNRIASYILTVHITQYCNHNAERYEPQHISGYSRSAKVLEKLVFKKLSSRRKKLLQDRKKFYNAFELQAMFLIRTSYAKCIEKKFFFTKQTFLLSELGNFFVFPLQKMFLDPWSNNFQRLKANGLFLWCIE
jgi:hypothetical protein